MAALDFPSAPATGDFYLSYVWDGVKWNATQFGSGGVAGPAVSTDNAVARFSGVTGNVLKNSTTFLVTDAGVATLTGTFGLNGSATFTSGRFSVIGTASFSGLASFSGVVNFTGSTNFTGVMTINRDGFDGFTIVGSSANSIGFRMQNATAGARNWVFGSSGGGPAANGSYFIYDDSGGGLRLEITSVGAVNIGTTNVAGTASFTSGAFNVNGTTTFTSGAFGVIGTALFTSTRFGVVGTALFTSNLFSVVGTSQFTGVTNIAGTTNITGFLTNVGTAQFTGGSFLVNGSALFTSGTFGIVGTTLVTGIVGIVGSSILTGTLTVSGTTVLTSVGTGVLIANAGIVTSAGGMVLLATLSPSNVASTNNTGVFTSAYRTYEITFDNICPVTQTTTFQMTVSTTGNAYVSGGYISVAMCNVSSVIVTDTSTSVLLLSGLRATTQLLTSTLQGLSGSIKLFNPAATTYNKHVVGAVSYATPGAIATTTLAQVQLNGQFNLSTALNGVNFLFSSGNIQTGVIKIYGMT